MCMSGLRPQRLAASRSHDSRCRWRRVMCTIAFYRDNCSAHVPSFACGHFEQGNAAGFAEYRVSNPALSCLEIPIPSDSTEVQWRRKLSGAGQLTDDAFYESTYTRRQLRDVVAEAGFRIELSQPTSHSFTLWQLGGPFREKGYYRTSPLAECLGAVLKHVLPWPFNYSTLIVARK